MKINENYMVNTTLKYIGMSPYYQPVNTATSLFMMPTFSWPELFLIEKPIMINPTTLLNVMLFQFSFFHGFFGFILAVTF